MAWTNEKRRVYAAGLQHVLGHVACPACEAAKEQIMLTSDLASLTFKHAAELWLSSRERFISPRTLYDYRQYIAALGVVFNTIILCDIHIGNIFHYQQERAKNAGATRINHELGVLQQILKRARLWHNIKDFYETLPMPKPKTGKALSPEDEDRLFLIASKNPRWKVAYWASSLTANTTAGPGEIRHLRMGDIDLEKRQLHIREGTKNEFRIRKIPLNDRAFKMACRLVDRAIELGAGSPDDFLLPHRAHSRNGGCDFSKPMYSWYTAWNKLRREAGLPWLRQYDLRHHSITRLLENPDVSEETVKSIAGHVSKRILETYSHIRMKAKEDALRALEQKSGRMAPVRMMPDSYFYRGKKSEGA